MAVDLLDITGETSNGRFPNAGAERAFGKGMEWVGRLGVVGCFRPLAASSALPKGPGAFAVGDPGYLGDTTPKHPRTVTNDRTLFGSRLLRDSHSGTLRSSQAPSRPSRRA